MNGTSPSELQFTNPPDPRLSSRQPLIHLTLLVLWVYVVIRLAPLWHSNTDYGFGWYIPLLSLCLFWERWKLRPEKSPVRPAAGTFLLMGLLAGVLIPGALFLEVIPQWRFAGWIFTTAAIGLTFILLYLLGGRNWSRHFAFPILFFVIAVPWPTRIERPLIESLSHLNAITATATANALGTPAVRHGVVIETGAGMVGVDEACSGIRSFQASVMIALFLGELFGYSLARRTALLFGAIALAFSCNVVRTTYLVRTSDLHGLQTVNLQHDRAGFIILAVTLAGLLLLAWLLRPRGNPTGSKNKAPVQIVPESLAQATSQALASGDTPVNPPAHEPLKPLQLARWTRLATAGLLIWIVLIETGIQVWFRPAEKQASSLADWRLILPSSFAELRESAVNEAIRTQLRFDEATTAGWRDVAGNPWQLYYFRWLPAANRYRATETCGAARGHAPDVCLRNAGLTLETNLGVQEITIKDVRLRVSSERFLDRGRTFHIFTGYWEPNEWTPQLPTTTSAISAVIRAVKTRDRGRNEKRVMKLGVWGVESDAQAERALREQLYAMIQK